MIDFNQHNDGQRGPCYRAAAIVYPAAHRRIAFEFLVIDYADQKSGSKYRMFASLRE
jgi:hypothetical protein